MTLKPSVLVAEDESALVTLLRYNLEREGYRVLHRLEEQPKPRALAEIGLAWAPFRSLAAWYLWRASDEAKRAREPTSRA